MKTIDVTGDKFDYVDGMISQMFFSSFKQGEAFRLYVDRATIFKELGESKETICIDSETEFCFEDAQGIIIDYWPSSKYIDSACFPCGCGRLDLRIGKLDANGSRDYLIGGGLKYLSGYIEITVFCKGKVIMIYDENTITTDFPGNYCYD